MAGPPIGTDRSEGGDGAFEKGGGASTRPLAVITGASSGIGYELARVCALNGFDLVVVADNKKIQDCAKQFSMLGVNVRAVEADLSKEGGVDTLYNAVQKVGRPVEALCANAGRGLGKSFLEQDWDEIIDVIDTNITGTVFLLQKFARDMCKRGKGRILVTGSIAGYVPGSYQAVYNGTKAFIDSFSWALRNEIKDTGVTVTCLMPGATETEFFEKAGMMDTPIGKMKKDSALAVAITGYAAMMSGQPSAVHGFKNKLQTIAGDLLPASLMAEAHRRQAQPWGAQR